MKSHFTMARYFASLKVALLFVLAMNVAVPLLCQLSAETRDYGSLLLGLHMLPLFVQRFDVPFNSEFFIYLGLSLAMAVNIVAGFDLAISCWRTVTLPIRIGFCAVWYALSLGLIWLVANAISGVGAR